MRPSNLLHLYRIRLRARLLQECFAIVGIAAGVALLFASQIASHSLSSSVAQLSRGIVGDATLQLRSRDAQGFDERLLARVRRTPGVRVAVPLLEANANVVGPRGSRSVELVGADESLARLGGALARHVQVAPFAGIGAILLPAPLADQIGVTGFGAEADLEVGGHTGRAPLYSRLSAAQIGPLIDAPIVVAPLPYAQELAGLRGHLTRILVEPRPGDKPAVRAALTRLAGGTLDVEPTSYDEGLFAEAAAVSNQSTVLFAVISALVGFLFAFNATLLTVPQRRRLIADLRRDGYDPQAVLAIVLFDALALGAVACVLGLLLGDELSTHLFHGNPGYLSSAFTVGSARTVGAQTIILAAAGGMLAALVAVVSPLCDILARDPLAGGRSATGGLSSGLTRQLTAGGALCLGTAVAILLAAPQLAILGMVVLTCSLLLLLAPALRVVLALVRRAAPAVTSATPHLAVMELRASATRAVAIAATGAVAVFGSVAIEGAHADLQRGLEGAAHEMNAFTDLWVSPAGTFDLLMTQPFSPTAVGRLERLSGVRAVRIYRGGLLDWGERRVWVIAPSRDSVPLVPSGQLLEGSPRSAGERVRRGGWAILSLALAREHHLHIGQAFVLPAPRPSRLRLAAISTNIGWAPGAIIVNAAEFARAWRSGAPSAYNVLLAPGADPMRVRGEILRALGPATGFVVQTARQHADKQRSLTRQGLARLTQVSKLILIAAVLAMTAALGTMIWQRRPRLAKLKLEGFAPVDLWLTILLESILLLGVGCVSGALFGLLGQQLLDRALGTIVSYPVARSVALQDAFATVTLVAFAAVAVLGLPGYLAARVPAAVAMAE